MAQSSGPVSWWIVLLPNLFASAAMILAMVLLFRKRRWRDSKLLARAATMPAEHIASEPRTIRDMVEGEEAFVDSSAVVTSKRRHEVFVAWDASLREAPERPHGLFSPLPIRRLERGFSLTTRPGDEFRTGPIPWGWYAPVTEIVQAIPSNVSPHQ